MKKYKKTANTQTYLNSVKKYKKYVKDTKKTQIEENDIIKKIVDDYDPFNIKIDGNGISSVQEDFIEGYKYATSFYPDCDLSDVRAFLVSSKFMKRLAKATDNNMFAACGGVYLSAIKYILVKEAGECKNETKDKVSSLLDEYSIKVDPQDAFVHELFHAISHASGRGTRKFMHLEEEFVYTHTIDWLRKRGFSDDDIVNHNFLPFAINDVLAKEKKEILLEIAKYHDTTNIPDDHEVWDEIMDINAELYVYKVIERARNKAKEMIKIRNTSGFVNSVSTVQEDRFSFLDFT